MDQNTAATRRKHYYVDEAGDSTIFNSKGHVLIGNEGVSRFFALGLLDVEDPVELAKAMEKLREELLADSYFKSIPSMQPHQRKTARCFHAKDDIAEVRREVFKLLTAHPLRFYAVVREKQSLLSYVRMRNERDPTYRYDQREVYDTLVSRLFKERLHKDDEYMIHFARRWRADRTKAFRDALEKAKDRFEKDWGIRGAGPIRVQTDVPWNCSALQAVDYFLWALQRAFERHEFRYLEFLWAKVALIHDIDDVRERDYGCYYTRKNILTPEAMAKRKPRI